MVQSREGWRRAFKHPETTGNVRSVSYLVSNDGTAGSSRVGSYLEVKSACLQHLVSQLALCKLTTTPLSNMHPTIVVPVLVAFGSGTPLACNAALRL
jgi:hypothetical protein